MSLINGRDIICNKFKDHIFDKNYNICHQNLILPTYRRVDAQSKTSITNVICPYKNKRRDLVFTDNQLKNAYKRLQHGKK